MPCAEQFVPEVAVAVLDVDEGEPHGRGTAGGGDEVVNQAIELRVRKHRTVVGASEAAIEDGVAICHAGRRPRGGWPRVAARVRELKPDQEIVRAAKLLAMCLD